MRDARSATFSRLVLAAGLFTALTLALFAWWARFPVPYRDDWDWLLWISQGPLTLGRLFQPHNEHMIPLPRLLMALQYHLQGANGTLLCWVAIASHALVAGTIVREVWRHWSHDEDSRNIVAGLTLLVMCFAYQLQSLVFVAAVLFPLVQAMTTVAITSTVSAAEHGPRSGTGRLWLATSLIASLGAMLTTSNGLVVPVVLAIVSYLRRQPRWVMAGHLLMAVAGGALFARVVLASSAATASGAVVPTRQLPAIAGYFFAFFAPFLTYGNASLGAVTGAIGALAGLAFCLRTVRRRDHATRLEHVAIGLMLFALGTSAMAAVGRAQFGLDQAAQSRYATFALVHWAALLVALAMWWQEQHGRFPTEGRTTRALVITTLTLFLAAHLFTGVVWVAKTGNIRAAGLALAAAVPDEEWIVTLHPLTGVIHAAVRATQSDGDHSLVSPLLGTHLAPAGRLRSCRSELVLGSSPAGVSLRLSGVLAEEAVRGFILDGRSTVIGLAERAPLVLVPNASRSEVTGAVLDALRHGYDRTRPSWIGFAAASGTDVSLLAVDERGHFLCQSTLAPP